LYNKKEIKKKVQLFWFFSLGDLEKRLEDRKKKMVRQA